MSNINDKYLSTVSLYIILNTNLNFNRLYSLKKIIRTLYKEVLSKIY